MLIKFAVRGFKSLENVEVELGQVNVFIGANGSGKSNLLEAIGVLSAAASGRIDDESLLRRGVRPGVPQLYKTSFAGSRLPTHISFSAQSLEALYEASLFNPMTDPKPAWSYHTENWKLGEQKIVGRSHRMHTPPNPEAGLAALKAVERASDDPALLLLAALRDYAIFSPNTPTLRGLTPEQQPRDPVGLSGGGLPSAIFQLLRLRHDDEYIREVISDILEMVDWAKSFGASTSSLMPLSPSAMASKHVIKFRDRYMVEGRNILSGYDASEGALYVLFAAVLATSSSTSPVIAIDNVDHGLNPRLAKALMQRLCEWYLTSSTAKQLLLTTHSPLALDGLKLQDDRIRLFTVARTTTGRTVVKRVVLSEQLRKRAEEGWTLSRLWVMGHLGGVSNV